MIRALTASGSEYDPAPDRTRRSLLLSGAGAVVGVTWVAPKVVGMSLRPDHAAAQSLPTTTTTTIPSDAPGWNVDLRADLDPTGDASTASSFGSFPGAGLPFAIARLAIDRMPGDLASSDRTTFSAAGSFAAHDAGHGCVVAVDAVGPAIGAPSSSMSDSGSFTQDFGSFSLTFHTRRAQKRYPVLSDAVDGNVVCTAHITCT